MQEGLTDDQEFPPEVERYVTISLIGIDAVFSLLQCTSVARSPFLPRIQYQACRKTRCARIWCVFFYARGRSFSSTGMRNTCTRTILSCARWMLFCARWILSCVGCALAACSSSQHNLIASSCSDHTMRQQLQSLFLSANGRNVSGKREGMAWMYGTIFTITTAFGV